MKLKIFDRWAMLVEDDSLRQNSTKPYEVKFIFDGSWDGYSKTVIFEAGPTSIVVVLTEDRCTVPAECLKHGSVRLKIGVYGVKEGNHKGTVWCLGSMIIPDAAIGMGGASGTPSPDDVYSEIMAAIGDLSAAGFEGKTLAEVLREIKNSVCETATDEEVGSMLNGTFGASSGSPADPGEELPDNTATNQEVEDVLNDVFGRQP